tara:strand:+ start:4526 stop:4750 length:225 start_codon:yes stop_codon:yes gene_type:complete
MSDFREAALDSLYHQAITDKVQAEASLHILLDHPAGIGDHSTKDLHNNLQEALSNLADAEDRIQTLKRFRTKYN